MQMHAVKKNVMRKILLQLLSIMLISPASGDLEQFLGEDTTDQHEYLPWYTCGHFARDLARNVSEHNLTIGSVILSSHPVFRGKCNSHIVNYIQINDTIIIIDPQTDEVYAMNPRMLYRGKILRYYKLYPDGTQVPSNWACNLAPTGIIE